MLQLYKENPISISMINNQKLVNVQFCNVEMKLKYCQFKLFYNYLTNKSKKLSSDTTHVDLLLVRDNLNVTITLEHFLQLCHGVQIVMFNKFGLKSNKYQT